MRPGQSFESLKEGEGKYNPECEVAFNSCEAEGVILAVINGNRGNGFSACVSQRIAMGLPNLLRSMADQIEAQIKQASKQ